MHWNFPTQTQNYRLPLTSSKTSSEMLLASGNLTTLKLEFSLFLTSKRRKPIGPLQVVTFHQPTTVDKDPKNSTLLHLYFCFQVSF